NEEPRNRTNAGHNAGFTSTNEHQLDVDGQPGQPRIELRIWSGNRLEVRVLSPARVVPSSKVLTGIDSEAPFHQTFVRSSLLTNLYGRSGLHPRPARTSFSMG